MVAIEPAVAHSFVAGAPNAAVRARDRSSRPRRDDEFTDWNWLRGWTMAPGSRGHARGSIGSASRAVVVLKRFGIDNTVAAVRAARKVGVDVALAAAVLEQESHGRNVFGHDSVPCGPRGGTVTKQAYLQYKKNRAKCGMQGVGPMQLTWWEFQDEADRRGGCWDPFVNIVVGLEVLQRLIARHGLADGIRRYNGSGPDAERYSREVRAKYEVWKRRLSGAGPPAPAPKVPPWPGRGFKLADPTVRGDDVRRWQEQMAARGWTVPTSGEYDLRSRDVCRSFQKEKGLEVDGIVGRRTWQATWAAPVT